MGSVCDCRSSGLTLPLLVSAQKRCLGFPYGINSDLLTIVVVKPRGPLSFKFYSCAPKARGAGCGELRGPKALPILFMQIKIEVLATKLVQNLSWDFFFKPSIPIVIWNILHTQQALAGWGMGLQKGAERCEGTFETQSNAGKHSEMRLYSPTFLEAWVQECLATGVGWLVLASLPGGKHVCCFVFFFLK